MAAEMRPGRSIEIVIGGTIAGFGALMLVAEYAGGKGWQLLWPFFVILPGLAFFAAMALLGRHAAFLAIPGWILTVAGLVLLYTNATGRWEAWAYAWALVSPASVGLGLWSYGLIDARPRPRQVGGWLTFAGVAAFVVLGAFFELLIGLGGTPVLAPVVWPVLLILLGLVLLFGSGPRRR